MNKIHFTRNWGHVICNRRIGCDGVAVVSDPALLAGFAILDVCANCTRLLSEEERRSRDRKYLELLGCMRGGGS